MLKQLTIKNFAIIEDITIDFHKGMSVFLGETGAGKSIIINAFALLIGKRANTSFIRSGETRAFVEAIIEIDYPNELLKEYKLSNNIFTFTRIITNDSNSYNKINGFNVSLQVLRDTLGKLVNIHSQHDTYYLLDEKNHLNLIDEFGSDLISKEKAIYLNQYEQYLLTLNKLRKLEKTTVDDDLDYLKFQLEEINKVNLQENELESLEEEIERIKNFNKISENINSALTILNGDHGILEQMYALRQFLYRIKDDKSFQENYEESENLYDSIQMLYEQIKSNFSNLDIDVNKIELLQQRMYEISKLKRKFGNTYEEIIEAREQFKEKISFLENKEQLISELQNKLAKEQKASLLLAKKLSATRKKCALELEEKIKQELKELHLKNTSFKVEFIVDELNETGIDAIQFLLSTNIGEALKPLSRVASGGEFSRIALGINTILNEIYGIKLSILDEIDSGVSGKIASSVGEKISKLSNSYQVIVISHLPQVIAHSDEFYYVGKVVEDNKTKTYVKLLNDQEKIVEIAKILSGKDKPDDLFIENARTLLKLN